MVFAVEAGWPSARLSRFCLTGVEFEQARGDRRLALRCRRVQHRGHGQRARGVGRRAGQREALPAAAANTASTLAVTAMLDPATPQAPVTAGLLVSSTPVKQNLDNLALGQPALHRDHDTLLGRADGIHAAPFTRSLDLYQRNLRHKRAPSQ